MYEKDSKSFRIYALYSENSDEPCIMGLKCSEEIQLNSEQFQVLQESYHRLL